MDNFFPSDSIINISDATIDNISRKNNTTFVTISYTDCINCRPSAQILRLVVTNSTLILDENGNIIPVTDLRKGMTINAAYSSATTRSIPPQATAFMFRIVRRPIPDSITVGRIINIDNNNRSFTVLSDGNAPTVIQFNVPDNARIFGLNDRPINFTQLMPGMRVRVRHASFMTASIPPQTTAFEIRVIR